MTDIVQVTINAELVLWVAASSLLVIGFLLIALAKVIVSGINKTISTGNAAIGIRHGEHERRINVLEKVVFRKAGP